MIDEQGGFATRWLLGNLKWSYWHWTDDGKVTLCGHAVRSGGEDLGLVEKVERPDLVDCARCVVQRQRIALGA